MQTFAPEYMRYLIWAVVVCAVLLLRLRLSSRGRKLRLGTLWIVPAIYTAFACMILFQFPPHGLQWLYSAIALGAGAAIGWRRGALMRITVDPETHTLNQQASPAAIMFIVVLMLIRGGLRYEAGSMGFSVALITDLLVMFLVGMLSVARLEMFLRARRMLREHLAETFS